MTPDLFASSRPERVVQKTSEFRRITPDKQLVIDGSPCRRPPTSLTLRHSLLCCASSGSIPHSSRLRDASAFGIRLLTTEGRVSAAASPAIRADIMAFDPRFFKSPTDGIRSAAKSQYSYQPPISTYLQPSVWGRHPTVRVDLLT